jgi:hypothetical protein
VSWNTFLWVYLVWVLLRLTAASLCLLSNLRNFFHYFLEYFSASHSSSPLLLWLQWLNVTSLLLAQVPEVPFIFIWSIFLWCLGWVIILLYIQVHYFFPCVFSILLLSPSAKFLLLLWSLTC